MNLQDKIGSFLGKFIKSDIGDILEILMKIVLTALGFAALFAILGFFMAWPVMKLWNGCLVPAVTIFHEIGWKQAWGISILCSLLLKTTVSNSNSKEK